MALAKIIFTFIISVLSVLTFVISVICAVFAQRCEKKYCILIKKYCGKIWMIQNFIIIFAAVIDY
jgi:hypothetical protein